MRVCCLSSNEPPTLLADSSCAAAADSRVVRNTDEGEERDFEIGVLSTSFSHATADIVLSALTAAGFDSRLNMPWSGRDGLMFSADSLAVSVPPGERKAIMLEVRNDLLVSKEYRHRLLAALVPALDHAHAHNFESWPDDPV